MLQDWHLFPVSRDGLVSDYHELVFSPGLGTLGTWVFRENWVRVFKPQNPGTWVFGFFSIILGRKCVTCTKNAGNFFRN